MRLKEELRADDRFKSEYFVHEYWASIVAYADEIERRRPACIIAQSRKANRLIEVLKHLRLLRTSAPVVTERAVDFMPPNDLRNKKILVVEDIVISGSTLQSLLKKLVNKYGKHGTRFEVLSLAIDSESIALQHDEDGYFFEIPQVESTEKVRLSYALDLPTEERLPFCHAIVRALALLNKPFDLDFCNFYFQNEARVVVSGLRENRAISMHDMTTIHQHNAGLQRLTAQVPQAWAACFLESIFRNTDFWRLQGSKVRIFSDRSAGDLTFVPMLTFAIHSEKLGQSLFGDRFRVYNELLDEVRKSTADCELAVREQAIYRFVFYVVNYLWGLFVLVHTSANWLEMRNTEHPSPWLRLSDSTFLFGPRLSFTVLRFLAGEYDGTIRELQGLRITTLSSARRMRRPAKGSSFDPQRKELYDKIREYVRLNMLDGQSLASQLAVVFEGIYTKVELPCEREMRLRGRILDSDLDRLKVGFNAQQLAEILRDLGSDSFPGDIYAQMSLALDFIIDTGAMIPIFNYERPDGWLERAYRHGEVVLSGKRFGWLVATVLSHLDEDMKRQGTADPAMWWISFEKLGVMFYNELYSHGKELVDALKTKEADDRDLNITPQYRRYGRVLQIVDDSRHRSHRPRMFVTWCTQQGIIKRERGFVRYSPAYLRRFAKEYSGGSPPQLISRNMVVGFVRLAEALYLTDTKVDKSQKSDYLTAITTCADSRTYLEAIREELVLFFKDEKWNLGGQLQQVSLVYDGGTSRPARRNHGILETLRKYPVSASRGIKDKKELRDNLPHIVNAVESHFDKPELYLLYGDSLWPYIIQTKTSLQKSKVVEVERLAQQLEFTGALCHELSIIVQRLLELGDEVWRARAKAGVSASKKEVSRKLDALMQSLMEWNSSIQSNAEIASLILGQAAVKKIDLAQDRVEQKMDATRLPIYLGSELLPQVKENYGALSHLFDVRFGRDMWELEMKRLFPTSTIDARPEVEFSSFMWAIDADILDSSGEFRRENKAKTPLLVERVTHGFETARTEVQDGDIHREGDRIIILTEEAKDIPAFLRVVMEAADGYNMFFRVGICGCSDSGSQLLHNKRYDDIEYDETLKLSARLRDFGKRPYEEQDYHTITISRSAFRAAWGGRESLPEDLRSGYDLVGKIGMEEQHLKGVDTYVPFYPFKVKPKTRAL